MRKETGICALEGFVAHRDRAGPHQDDTIGLKQQNRTEDLVIEINASNERPNIIFNVEDE